MFPVLITYFIPDQGIKSKLLDFYLDDYEDSDAITKQLLRTLEDNSLPVSSMTSYSADNASVNYGNKKSVFQKLKDKVPGLVKASCFCRVLHNAGKYAFKNIDPRFDVETLVSKVYAQFKCSTVRMRNLKECFDYFSMEYVTLVAHIPTRWLSLARCVDHVIKAWPALKEYFLEVGEADCNNFLLKFVQSQNNTIDDDPIPSIFEVYLHLYQFFFHGLVGPLKKLQFDLITSAEIYKVINDLKFELTKQLTDNYFGDFARKAFLTMGEDDKTSFISVALSVYERTLSYLNRYDLSVLKLLSCLDIKQSFGACCNIGNYSECR